MESEEDSHISVWFCREEKLVSGLSRRTTCADVMRALLLEDQQNLSGGSPRSCYCIVEKWRGFERILPHKTKILRLWSAWGEEQENVRFVLVKNEASKLPNHGPRSAEARVVLSKEHHAISKESVVKGTARATMGGFSSEGTARDTTEGTARATMGGFSPEKQRRIVRKAFRKLDKINKKKRAMATTSRDTSSAEKMETLVHLVISQDHAVRQQIQRIQELDAEIERCEAKVHFDRIKRHGVNYVQDTYLCVDVTGTDTLCTGEGEELCLVVGGLARFEEYVQRCEEVVQLQEQLTEHEALMEKVTVEIQEELNQRWMERRQNELSGKKTCERASSSSSSSSSSVQSIDTDCLSPGTDTPPENELLLEEERIKTQLDTSLYIGLRLNTDLEAIRNDLNLIQEIWGEKEREITELLEKVTTLDMQEGSLKSEKGNLLAAETEVMCTLDTKTEWVEQARGLSKTCNVNDDDSSDTGLSSLHSQDSDNLPICESLV